MPLDARGRAEAMLQRATVPASRPAHRCRSMDRTPRASPGRSRRATFADSGQWPSDHGHPSGRPRCRARARGLRERARAGAPVQRIGAPGHGAECGLHRHSDPADHPPVRHDAPGHTVPGPRDRSRSCGRPHCDPAWRVGRRDRAGRSRSVRRRRTWPRWRRQIRPSSSGSPTRSWPACQRAPPIPSIRRSWLSARRGWWDRGWSLDRMDWRSTCRSRSTSPEAWLATWGTTSW